MQRIKETDKLINNLAATCNKYKEYLSCILMHNFQSIIQWLHCSVRQETGMFYYTSKWLKLQKTEYLYIIMLNYNYVYSITNFLHIGKELQFQNKLITGLCFYKSVYPYIASDCKVSH